MSQENIVVAKVGTRRPIADQIVLRMPFLVDFALARLASLPPGSSLRRRLVPWGLRHGFEAIARTDFDVPLLAYEPDVEIFISGAAGVGFAEGYRGHPGLLEFFRDSIESFAETRYTVKRLLDAGDRWVAEMESLGEGKASGAVVTTNWGGVYYLSPRGKIRRQDLLLGHGHDGWKQALEAVGLSE